jgi:CRP/FNR family transcriptional regulator, cyclic AMP receptor protein
LSYSPECVERCSRKFAACLEGAVGSPATHATRDCVGGHGSLPPPFGIILPMPEWMPLDQLERLLSRVDVLEPLTPRELRALASGSTLDRLRAQEAMTVGPQAHARQLILLLEGRATVYEPGPRESRRLTVSIAEAGTVVGVAGLAVRPQGLRIEASAPSLFAIVRWGVFEEIVRRNPEVSLRLLRVLGERIGILEARLGELAYKGVQARLANAIMRLVEGEGVVGPEGSRLLTRYTHWQLASIIGANREATTRAMRHLRERGAIEVEGRRIRVTDREALERVAQDGEAS